MRKDSYESILRAVGRVLDLAEADGFAVRDTEDGLLLEAFDANHIPTIVLNLDIPALAQVLDWASQREAPHEHPQYARASAADKGTLRQVLAQRPRELVGAH